MSAVGTVGALLAVLGSGCKTTTDPGVSGTTDTGTDESTSANETGTETTTETETETETETTAEGDCVEHIDCPGEAPFCFFGACSPCGETNDPAGACVTLTDGQAPVCADDVCVECSADDPGACEDSSYLCDLDTNSCYACTAHDECPGEAGCDIVTGACLPADAVIHVNGDGGQDYATITAGLGALGGGSGTIIIHALDDPAWYPESVSISGQRVVTLISADGRAVLSPDQGPASVTISDGARVYLSGLTIYGPERPVAVTGAHVELDRVLSYSGQPLLIEDAIAVLTNTMITVFSTAVEIVGTSALSMNYVTALSFSAMDPITSCPDATVAQGSIVRNSFLGNAGDGGVFDCDDLTYISNVVNGAFAPPGNITVGPDIDGDWFVDIPDLHLAPGAPIALSSAATWTTDDPTTDFDGDPRPTRDGSPDFAGADVP